MPRFEVTVLREVSDILRTFVEVEAEDREAAEAEALKIIADRPDEYEFAFWQCGDCIGPDWTEVREIEAEIKEERIEAGEQVPS